MSIENICNEKIIMNFNKKFPILYQKNNSNNKIIIVYIKNIITIINVNQRISYLYYKVLFLILMKKIMTNID